MSRKLLSFALFAILFMPLVSSEDLDKYLDCLNDKKVDIIFVFDTTNSMGGEISELRAVANKFVRDLETSNIDFQLGLLEFRDFPKTCDSFLCGSPGDFAYQLKGNGTLTFDVSTFSSWLGELEAGGGGSPGPEAVLTALRHAVKDTTWRLDAEKVIILLTDEGPHPDGSCCNAEGDTLDGTIYELTDQGARVYVIGPDDESVKKIAKDTGGQFYEIRSGLSLKPLLEEITQSMSCSFNIEVNAACENKTLKAEVQLVGKETVPYVAGQTEVWMYPVRAGNKSRYDMTFDSIAGAYTAEVIDVCGPVDLIVYGRVGERSAARTVQVDCGSCGTIAITEQGLLSISGQIFNDSNSDGIKNAGEAGLDDQLINMVAPDGRSVAVKTDREGHYIFAGLSPGQYYLGALAQENWTATIPAEGVQEVKLIDLHESEIDFGFKPRPIASKTIAEDIAVSWQTTFNNSYYDSLVSVVQTDDGGYVAVGEVENSYLNQDVWLVKTDRFGVQVWNRTFGGDGMDGAESVWQTNDGGYIIAGYTKSFGTQNEDGVITEDAWLIKTDSEGIELWAKTFGGQGNEFAKSVEQTADGGYIVAGKGDPSSFKGRRLSEGYENIQKFIWLFKINSEGSMLWEKAYDIKEVYEYGSLRYYGGGRESDNCIVRQTIDGGYIIASSTEPPDDITKEKYTPDICLIKTDSEGNNLWQQTFGGNNRDEAYSVQETNDGGYIVVGGTAVGEDSYHINKTWLIKTDAEGIKVWDNVFDGFHVEDGGDPVCQTSDGGYIVVNQGQLIKTDSGGNKIWDKTLGGEWGDNLYSVSKTSDEGYIIAGQKGLIRYEFWPTDAWLIKTDANGNV